MVAVTRVRRSKSLTSLDALKEGGAGQGTANGAAGAAATPDLSPAYIQDTINKTHRLAVMLKKAEEDKSRLLAELRAAEAEKLTAIRYRYGACRPLATPPPSFPIHTPPPFPPFSPPHCFLLINYRSLRLSADATAVAEVAEAELAASQRRSRGRTGLQRLPLRNSSAGASAGGGDAFRAATTAGPGEGSGRGRGHGNGGGPANSAAAAAAVGLAGRAELRKLQAHLESEKERRRKLSLKRAVARERRRERRKARRERDGHVAGSGASQDHGKRSTSRTPLLFHSHFFLEGGMLGLNDFLNVLRHPPLTPATHRLIVVSVCTGHASRGQSGSREGGRRSRRRSARSRAAELSASWSWSDNDVAANGAAAGGDTAASSARLARQPPSSPVRRREAPPRSPQYAWVFADGAFKVTGDGTGARSTPTASERCGKLGLWWLGCGSGSCVWGGGYVHVDCSLVAARLL